MTVIELIEKMTSHLKENPDIADHEVFLCLEETDDGGEERMYRDIEILDALPNIVDSTPKYWIYNWE